MLFNSLDFALFLPIVFFLYWYVTNRNLELQNLLIVASSYVFYGWWDWRFLSLIFASTLLDFFVGLALRGDKRRLRQKLLLALSICINLGFLGFFKYFNFFVESISSAFSFFGTSLDTPSLNIILPVGISFYTFQTLSYSIDVYKRKLEPTRDFVAFAAFVSFFPQLVAGPIERATRLLPQFSVPREFSREKAVDGLRQILWGLFKKVVIADGCAEFANLIFNNSDQYSGSTLVVGALFFSFQIYGDFSGYSDIAIGTARLFGFDLMRNFAFPYFSRDIAEFWRRWHISLSTWFRDYLYIPIGGSRGGLSMQVRNVFVIFIVSGFWHGANWTFVVWGALNALYFLPLMLLKRNRSNLEIVASGRLLPSLGEIVAIGTTFGLTVLAWIFFRAESLKHAAQILSRIFSLSLITTPQFNGMGRALTVVLLVVIFTGIEWWGREEQYAIKRLGIGWNRPFRYGLYYLIVIAIFWFGGQEQQFIYFQF